MLLTTISITIGVWIIPLLLTFIVLVAGYTLNSGDWDFVTPVLTLTSILLIWLVYNIIMRFIE